MFNLSQRKILIIALLALAFLSGCQQNAPGSSDESLLDTGTSTSGGGSDGTSGGGSTQFNPDSGLHSVAILFRSANPNGSFNTPPSNGVNAATGHEAVRLFATDGSTTVVASIDSGEKSDTWPAWLTKVSISISGSNNAKAPNENCARFAEATEINNSCNFGGSTLSCGAPGGIYRVSEMDCGTTVAGSGQVDDGVQVRIEVDRTIMNDNLMVSLEYTSSVANINSNNPASCFTGSELTPNKVDCMEHSWQMFLRKSATDTTETGSPFMWLLAPYTQTNAANLLGGGPSRSQQIVVPLRAHSEITTMMISRRHGPAAAQIAANCDPSGKLGTGDPVSSPLCSGITLHRMILHRMN